MTPACSVILYRRQNENIKIVELKENCNVPKRNGLGIFLINVKLQIKKNNDFLRLELQPHFRLAYFSEKIILGQINSQKVR